VARQWRRAGLTGVEQCSGEESGTVAGDGHGEVVENKEEGEDALRH
jgi:hypothetical protein